MTERRDDKTGSDDLLRDRWLRTSPLLLMAMAPVVFFGAMIWSRRWMSDDGFINIRIIENLLAGHGPVFNAGERVEAYTSTLWVGVVALLGWVGFPLENAAVYAGLIFSMAGVVLAQLGALRLWADGDSLPATLSGRALVPLGMLIYVVLPPAWDFGTSGLETGLAIGWLGLVFFAMARVVTADESERGLPLGTVALLGLGPLVRPELTLFSFGLLVPVLWSSIRRQEWRATLLLKLGAAMGAVPVAYQIFRMGYFAALVPNTAIAKVAFDSRWEQGLNYAENFFGLYLLAIPLIVAAGFLCSALILRGHRKDWLQVSAFAAPAFCGLLYCSYVVYVGGDFMHGRMFLPGLFGMLLPVAMVPLRWPVTSRVTTVAGVAAAILITVWSAYCATSIRVDRENVHGIGDERGWYARQAEMDNPISLSDFEEHYFIGDARSLRNAVDRECQRLARRGQSEDCESFVFVERRHGDLEPWRASFPMRQEVAERGFEAVVMRSGIGMRTLTMGPEVHVVDRIGLSDPFAARKELARRGRPGHEKALPNYWYIARFSEPVSGEDARIGAARRALECGDLAELADAVEGELTPRRFVRNMRLSFRFHRLEFNPDPWKAEAEFCGTSPPWERIYGGSGGTVVRWDCPQDYQLVELRKRRARDEDAIASIQPVCQRDDHRVTGPVLGGTTGGVRQTLSCTDGEALAGISGEYDRFVSTMQAHCPGDEVTDGLRQFTATCVEGAQLVGVVARAGALVDAIGVRCAD